MALRFSLDAQRTEAAAGAAVAGAALLGFALANSPEAHRYFTLIGMDFTVRIGAFSETMSRGAWIRHGLMALYFFVIGLELKQEVLRGELSSPRRLALPALAALGGMVVPILLCLALTWRGGGSDGAWPVAAANDGVIALAVLSLVGRGLPQSLKVFLQAMTVAGQLAVSVLIALLYTGQIHTWPLAGAALALMGLIALSEWKDAPFLFRSLGYLLLWGFVLKSGIDTALAGLAAALTVPGTGRRPGHEAALRNYLRTLKPYVDFAVLPLFALTAAGIPVAGAPLWAAAPLALTTALVLGKPAGVIAATFIAIRMGLARRPTGASWLELWGLAALAGSPLVIGLFLSGLAFPPPDPGASGSTLAVMAAATVSAGVGALALGASAAQRRRLRPEIDEAA
ncbi:Na+/H+ antiporter NhaA [Phenylobacterium montanum]|uniref:Na(+)/H(+) antiporter NhaA n=1 Tax=Phenylobacterium montanum TaxID=2823693 RepID=A0A975FYP8_9CAUL|nr:Na+/H+ antiporter NhaA [Caulobacter sp. S6]QUD87282.1 Na+/H+ antiporter NhaA [Caulobacter sp. S6]